MFKPGDGSSDRLVSGRERKHVSLDLMSDDPLACFGAVRCGKIIYRVI